MMNILREWKTLGILGRMLVIGASVALLVLAAPALAETNMAYNATFVEPYGGPSNSPFECPPGTSCGTANLSKLGHGSSVVYFFGCGGDCQLRIITFDDGSQLVVNEYANLANFASPGNSGNNGYIGFGLPGNPQFLDVTQTIVGGTGRFADVIGGSGAGTVRIAGGVAIITATGTIVFP
jgi:hypothetical protein